MRKWIVLSVFLLAAGMLFARPQKREVVKDTIVNAPLKTMLAVAERFCYQFQACPDSLFTWAYKGTGKVKTAEASTQKKKNAIELNYKDRVYDPKQKTGDVAIDIYVLGVRWWKDQHLGTKRVLSRPANSPYPLTEHMKATYSGSILEGGDFILQMEPVSPDQTRVHYTFSLTFGKVLSSFISDATWQDAIEWRLSMIFENLVEYAETGKVTKKKRDSKK